MTTNKENDARQFVRAMKADIRHQTRHMRWAVWALAGVGACTTIAGWMIPSPPAFILGGVLFAVALGIQFAAMRSFNSDKEIMGFVVQEDWKKLAQSVKAAYVKQDKMQIVEKTKLISILEAFGAAYNARSTNNEHDFYLGKLIGTGRIEGTVEQVMGTVPVLSSSKKVSSLSRLRPTSTQAKRLFLAKPLLTVWIKKVLVRLSI
jgi:hypothetical protein